MRLKITVLEISRMSKTFTKVVVLLSSLTAIAHCSFNGVRIQRPFYVIGHMANDASTVADFLGAGANALEMDVRFDQFGLPLEVFHGLPCDCFRFCRARTPFAEHIAFIHKADLNAQLALLMLDLKIPKDTSQDVLLKSGIFLMLAIIDNLWAGDQSPVPVVLSTSSVSAGAVFSGAKVVLERPEFQHFVPFLGFEISGRNPLDKIRGMFHSLNITQHIWQGDGISNCFNPLYIPFRLKHLLQNRDAGDYMSRVYRWTVDLPMQLNLYLSMGVDAIITNKPRILKALLPEYSNVYRLATRWDNAFSRL